MNQLENAFSSLVNMLPAIVMGIVLIIIAWLVATLVRKGVQAALHAMNLDEKLQGDSDRMRTAEPETSMADIIAQVFYYLVWVLFLPAIFDTFGLTTVAQPIQNMLDTALSYLPNIIAAAALVAIAVVVGRFVKNLVYNLALSLNIDRWVTKLTSQDSEMKTRTGVSRENKDTMAKVLANIVYVLILIPILIVALEALGIRSISEPIINVLNTIMAAIPNILVAAILLAVGVAIAKFVGDLVTNLLKGTGINNLTDNVNMKGTQNLDLAKISGQIVAVLIGLFFFVEALNALNLEILNRIGAAIIAYLPNVIFAIIILGLGVIGGQWLAGILSRSTGSQWAGRTTQYVLIAFALFMVLDQLNFASDIVNTAFIFIIGGLSVAFALSFGLGGRDFARKQLEKLDNKVEKESKKEGETSVNTDPADNIDL